MKIINRIWKHQQPTTLAQNTMPVLEVDPKSVKTRTKGHRRYLRIFSMMLVVISLISVLPLSASAAGDVPARPIAVDGGKKHSIILYNDGKVVTLGDDTHGQRSTTGWRDIVAVSTFYDHTLGLKSDGTVVAAGENADGQCEVENWKDITAIAAGSRHSVGVRKNGTVVAAGANENGQCDVSDWRDIVAVCANNTSTFGLTSEGKVLVAGSFYNEYLNRWSDVVSISASNNHVVGVHSDGTISTVGANDKGQRDNMEKWDDTLQAAAGSGFTVGLRSTGGVWVHGCDEHNEHAAMQFTKCVTIGTGIEHILAVKEDGTLYAKGTNDCGQCDVYRLNQKLEGK